MVFVKGKRVEIIDSNCLVDGFTGTLKSKVTNDMFLVKLDTNEESLQHNLQACVVMLPSYAVRPI